MPMSEAPLLVCRAKYLLPLAAPDRGRRIRDGYVLAQGDQILDAVAEVLKRDYGVARVVLRKKEYFSRPASRELLDEIAKEVDVVVSALGG